MIYFKKALPLYFILCLCVLSISACTQTDSNQEGNTKHTTEKQNLSAQSPSSPLTTYLGGSQTEGFERAIKPKTFTFPADHRTHPRFRNEWWYVTGNVKAENNQHFGFQVTFFRLANQPQTLNARSRKHASPWRHEHIWMAHVALTDVQGKQHYFDQRFARQANGLAGQTGGVALSTQQPFRVWLEDWQIIGPPDAHFPWQIEVKTDDFALSLNLQPEKRIVLQGDNGLSQKSHAAGNASYYYSMPRLATQGSIQINNTDYKVTGQAWLDREWSTSALGDNQAGWDWFSLQLNDYTDIMYYRLRTKDGKTDVHSSGKWIPQHGKDEPLSRDTVTLKPLRFWQSNQGVRYPIKWLMQLKNQKKQLIIEALIDQQEMQTLVNYWEGAVSIRDSKSVEEIIGYGYLEMSGYH